MRPMVSTLRLLSRRAALLAAVAGTIAAKAHAETPPADLDAQAFILADGTRLPYRAWLPGAGWNGPPDAVILALHGFNDSRDAWELPAPIFAHAGMAVYACDQRGFGGTAARGSWEGSDRMQRDAASIAALLRARHPGSRLVLMGESMGGAVLLAMAARDFAPPDAQYVLLAPAVWGRAGMNLIYRAGLWFAANLVPNLSATRPPPGVRIVPTDNMDAWVSLSRNPLTVRNTRFGTIAGLVDLMDDALAAAAHFPSTGLFLYGGEDMLIPKAATRATWRALPKAQATCAFYRSGHHLLLRDRGRIIPINDIIAWIRTPQSPLPSGADHAANAFLSADG